MTHELAKCPNRMCTYYPCGLCGGKRKVAMALAVEYELMGIEYETWWHRAVYKLLARHKQDE